MPLFNLMMEENHEKVKQILVIDKRKPKNSRSMYRAVGKCEKRMELR